jgi:hypothetical protein
MTLTTAQTYHGTIIQHPTSNNSYKWQAKTVNRGTISWKQPTNHWNSPNAVTMSWNSTLSIRETNHGTPCKSDRPLQLIVQDKHNNRVAIQHTPTNEATKYLRCWKAPQGQKQQKAALAKKCKEYARIINCSTLTRRETKYFYEGIHKPSVGYPIPTTYFTAKELNKIQAKAHQAMITHCGYKRYTAKLVIYGFERLGETAFNHLYDIQGYGQLELFLKSWRGNLTHQGKILWVAVQWAQYCAGTNRAILEDAMTKLPHLESEWLVSPWKYLEVINGSLQVDQPGIPPPMREHDQYLMIIDIQMNQYKPHQLWKSTTVDCT